MILTFKESELVTMLKYDVEKIQSDSELMEVINADNALNDAIHELSRKVGKNYLEVDATMHSSDWIDSEYSNDYALLRKQEQHVEWLMVKYCAFHQVPKSELEDVMYYMSDY